MKIGGDEAFGLAKLPRGSNDNVSKIVNSFIYIASEKTGHCITGCIPELYGLVGDNTQDYSTEKFLTLNYAFKKLNIVNSNSDNKHVILHFNTITDKIPKFLLCLFEHLEMSNKVIGNYEDFKYSKNKSILATNVCSLRGLEHSYITIIVNQDLYSAQHYLVEAMARCTNKLALIVLQKSKTASRIIEKWRDGLNGKPLTDWWKVQISPRVNPNNLKDDKRKLDTINSSSFIFGQHEVENYYFQIELAAEEFIEK